MRNITTDYGSNNCSLVTGIGSGFPRKLRMT